MIGKDFFIFFYKNLPKIEMMLIFTQITNGYLLPMMRP